MKKTNKTTEETLEKDLKDINHVLNHFLKMHFTIELDCLQQYLHNVKDLLIELTTKKIAPILTNVFSKFSNILQPFTSYSYDLSLDSLKQEVAQLRDRNHKLTKKVHSLKTDLEQYRIKSNRTTEFIYMLRVNNINIDELYRMGTTNIKSNQNNYEQTETQLPRTGVELQREEWVNGLTKDQESNLTSQYVSVKSKR